VLRDIDTIPQVDGWPLLGQLPEFRFARMELFASVPERYGPVARLRLGPLNVVLITDASLAREVLLEQADAFTKSRTLARFARPLLGDGLLTSEHEVHRKQRKLLAPLFTPRVVAQWADAMVARGEATAARWSDGSVIDVPVEMMRMTLEIVGQTLFDVDVAGDAMWLGEELAVADRHASAETARLVPLPLAVPTPARFRNARAIAHIDRLVATLISERRRQAGSRRDLLSLLVRAQDPDDGRAMTDREVRDEVMTMFLAGHETTANALSWTWMLLAASPDVRSRLEAELDASLDGRLPSYDDLDRLPFTLKVIKESMRLCPPVYAIGRVAEHDVVIGDLKVRRGTTLAINVYGMHRRPELFPDPLRFEPDRFTPEFEAALPRSSYMPFGSGPRVCIGSHFAMMEAHLLVATIGRRVSLEWVAGTRPRPNPHITLRPQGLRLRVRTRL
jgi:cytochrome P450